MQMKRPAGSLPTVAHALDRACAAVEMLSTELDGAARAGAITSELEPDTQRRKQSR